MRELVKRTIARAATLAVPMVTNIDLTYISLSTRLSDSLALSYKDCAWRVLIVVERSMLSMPRFMHSFSRRFAAGSSGCILLTQ